MQRKYEEAAAYYERIYVMYGKYRNWCAKAYLARAECLTRTQQYNKAAETLQAMLAVPELASMPEAQTAQERLASLQKKLQHTTGGTP